MIKKIKHLLKKKVSKKKNVFFFTNNNYKNNASCTVNAFDFKWKKNIKSKISSNKKYLKKKINSFYYHYAFNSRDDFYRFISKKKNILDAGCGNGYKTDFFSKLSPSSTVIGADLSNSIFLSSKNYKRENLFFLRADISKTEIKKNSLDLIICDQAIMHTNNPKKTLRHFNKILNKNGTLLCYWYKKKALPRELLDNFFLKNVKKLSNNKIFNFSKQMTILGKNLSHINHEFYCPDIPILGIKRGYYNIQRFLYYNFIKCYYNNYFGDAVSDLTNFDWYSVSHAKKYDKKQLINEVKECKFKFIKLIETDYSFSGKLKKISD